MSRQLVTGGAELRRLLLLGGLAGLVLGLAQRHNDGAWMTGYLAGHDDASRVAGEVYGENGQDKP